MRESKKERERERKKGQKQERLISRRRWPLIAPELREQGESQDKGKKQRNIRKYADSNATSSLGQPSALVSSWLPLPARLYTSFPYLPLSLSSRGILWIHVEEKFIRKLDNAFGLWPRRLSSPFLTRLSLSDVLSCAHTRACKEGWRASST